MDNKYQQISLHIRNEIIALALDDMKLPGIRELSTHFGVTTITLRKALKLLEKDGLLEVRGTSGTYLTKKAGRERRFLNFGLLVYDIFSLVNPYFNRIGRGFNSFLEEREAGYLQLLTIPITGKYRKAGLQRICGMIEKGLINALAVTIPLQRNELRLLRDTGVPLVSINRKLPDCPYVMENPRRGAELLCRAFQRAGVSAPVLLAPVEIPENVIQGTDIIHLLTEMLKQNHCITKTPPVFRLPREELFPGAGIEYLEKVFNEHPETDCVFAMGDLLIREADKFLYRGKRKIPLIAYSDEEPVDGACVIAPPLRKIGQTAAELLLKQIQTGDTKLGITGIELDPYPIEQADSGVSQESFSARMEEILNTESRSGKTESIQA